jgi:hypothetical protein
MPTTLNTENAEQQKVIPIYDRNPMYHGQGKIFLFPPPAPSTQTHSRKGRGAIGFPHPLRERVSRRGGRGERRFRSSQRFRNSAPSSGLRLPYPTRGEGKLRAACPFRRREAVGVHCTRPGNTAHKGACNAPLPGKPAYTSRGGRRRTQQPSSDTKNILFYCKMK